MFLASSIGAIGFAAGSFFIAYPDWFRVGITLLVGLLLVLIVWWMLPSSTVEFDVRKGVVLKDGRRIARIADIDCVLITEPAIGTEEPYFVELRHGTGPALLLGYTKDQVDASSLAARVAGAIDRPVKVAGT
jgi:hypothetical protein